MTHSSIISVRFMLLLIFFTGMSMHGINAQNQPTFRLSLAASAGYAPVVTLGTRENSGVVLSCYGELEYGKVIGRLQYTSPLLSTFSEDNLNNGAAYHGALGYRFDLSDQFFIGMLLGGGATVTSYSNGINGSGGDRFTNVSPQAGVILAPTYQLNDLLSLQGGLRYYKGFKAGDRGRASDLMAISVGLRISF